MDELFTKRKLILYGICRGLLVACVVSCLFGVGLKVLLVKASTAVVIALYVCSWIAALGIGWLVGKRYYQRTRKK